jgi:4-diphosphocytidyl-2-C-methyl-D-erythritol kinase
MIIFPQAKINLGLHVLHKRSDSYHELETCMVSIPLYDILEILPSDNFEFHQSGIEVGGEMQSNLCVKAFELIKSNYSISPVYMHLRKQIPMGAGLGGGSSDAAHVINGLNDLFGLNIPQARREELAASLGSDCPFFVEGTPKIAQGRGEVLAPISLDLKGYHLLLIYPNIHVSTSEAYSNVSFYSGDLSIREILAQPIDEWKFNLQNTFEKHIFEIHPRLKSLRDEMYEAGAIYSAMSGSGSTIFGIFKEKPNFEFNGKEDAVYFLEF